MNLSHTLYLRPYVFHSYYFFVVHSRFKRPYVFQSIASPPARLYITGSPLALITILLYTEHLFASGMWVWLIATLVRDVCEHVSLQKLYLAKSTKQYLQTIAPARIPTVVLETQEEVTDSSERQEEVTVSRKRKETARLVDVRVHPPTKRKDSHRKPLPTSKVVLAHQESSQEIYTNSQVPILFLVIVCDEFITYTISSSLPGLLPLFLMLPLTLINRTLPLPLTLALILQPYRLPCEVEKICQLVGGNANSLQVEESIKEAKMSFPMRQLSNNMIHHMQISFATMRQPILTRSFLVHFIVVLSLCLPLCVTEM
jgi:hypothetical protein